MRRRGAAHALCGRGLGYIGAARLYGVVIGLLVLSHGCLLSELDFGPVGGIVQHELLARKRSSGLELTAHLQLGLHLSRDRDLASRKSVLRVCRLVVY